MTLTYFYPTTTQLFFRELTRRKIWCPRDKVVTLTYFYPTTTQLFFREWWTSTKLMFFCFLAQAVCANPTLSWPTVVTCLQQPPQSFVTFQTATYFFFFFPKLKLCTGRLFYVILVSRILNLSVGWKYVITLTNTHNTVCEWRHNICTRIIQVDHVTKSGLFFQGGWGVGRTREALTFLPTPSLNELYYPSLTARWAEISLEYCYKIERKVFLKKLAVTLRRQLPTVTNMDTIVVSDLCRDFASCSARYKTPHNVNR